jgi:HAD superfamily hydrolase (TIGR01509 family)
MNRENSFSTIDLTCRITAVLFDFDGTLTRPGALDFAAIRRAVGCPAGAPLIEFIEAIGPAEARIRANAVLEAYEMAAATVSAPAVGAEALVGNLRKRRVPCGILTRNSAKAVKRALGNFSAIGADDFVIIITRETAVAPKPSGDGVHLAAAHFGVPVEEVLVVGDFVFDIQAGLQAGALTAHVGQNPNEGCHYRAATLDDLWELIRPALP